MNCKPLPRGAAFGLALALAAFTVHAANTYPSKPIRFVVGYAAGGPTDVIARLVAQDVQTALGQTVVVDNKSGANGNIATEEVARAQADGYTVIVNTLSHNVNALLGAGKVKYDPVKDFAPISLAVVLPQVIIVGAQSPYASVADRVAQKQVKVLAVTTAKRHPDFAAVPTMAEAGFPGFEDYVGPVGFLAPARTPEPVLAKLSAAIRASLARPAIQEKLRGLGAVVVGSTPGEYRTWLQSDHERWAKLIKDADVKAE